MVHSLHSWRFVDRSLAVDTYPLLGECYHTSFDTANREQEWVVCWARSSRATVRHFGPRFTLSGDTEICFRAS